VKEQLPLQETGGGLMGADMQDHMSHGVIL
jgi:hypothetical protein